MAKITLVDDDENITTSVGLALESHGHTVKAYYDGAAGLAALESDPPDLRAVDANGTPLIPQHSHLRLASAESHNGARMLRRSFNFVDGVDGRGHLDAGLFFVCFVRNLQTQFVPVQRTLSADDRMMDYLEHTGSAVFACSPGLRDGEYWGQRLLEGKA